MEKSEFRLIENMKLISIYIFNKESSIRAINDIYASVNRFSLNTELIKITSISFSLAVKESENTELFIKSLKDFSDVKIRKNLSVLHIKNNSFSADLLSEMFSRLDEEELKMIHYRLDSKRVTIISDKHRLNEICRKIKELLHF